MKEIHYRNIGYPRTGTTWLYLQLIQNPDIDCKNTEKEFKCDNLELYKKKYFNYKRSINFNPNVYKPHRKNHYNHPKHIHEYTTHLSIIFRNPYELINSFYNFSKNNLKKSIPFSNVLFIKKLEEIDIFINYKNFFEYWNRCKLPINYLFYDDLCKDSIKFVIDICDFIGIKRNYKNVVFKNEALITENVYFAEKNLVSYINDNISILEEKTNRDLSHWKR